MEKYFLIKESEFNKFQDGKIESNDLKMQQIEGEQATRLLDGTIKEKKDIQIVTASFGF